MDEEDGGVVFEIWPKFFGVEAKNDEDALQARRHGLMKERRKDGDWSDRPYS